MNANDKQNILNALESLHQDQHELARLEEAHELASITADDIRQQINRINGEIATLTNHHQNLERNGRTPDRGDLDTLIAQRDTLLVSAEKAGADLDRLNRDMRTLHLSIHHPQHTAVTRNDVLIVQVDLEEKRGALTKVEAAIAGERERIAAAVGSTAPVDELRRQLEDLLSDGIDNKAQAEAIDNLQARLNAAHADLQRDREAATALVERAEQTIAGLERKRQSLRAALDSAIEAHRDAVRLFLHTEMAHLRASYLEAGHALTDAFTRMRALELLARNVTGTGKFRAFAGDITMLDIPQPFDPSGCKDPALRVTPDITTLHRLRTEYEAIGLKLANP